MPHKYAVLLSVAEFKDDDFQWTTPGPWPPWPAGIPRFHLGFEGSPPVSGPGMTMLALKAMSVLIIMTLPAAASAVAAYTPQESETKIQTLNIAIDTSR